MEQIRSDGTDWENPKNKEVFWIEYGEPLNKDVFWRGLGEL